MTTKGLLKHRIEETLRERGPMKTREIAEVLGEDPRAVAACMISLAYAGRILAVRRDPIRGNDWIAV